MFIRWFVLNQYPWISSVLLQVWDHANLAELFGKHFCLHQVISSDKLGYTKVLDDYLLYMLHNKNQDKITNIVVWDIDI